MLLAIRFKAAKHEEPLLMKAAQVETCRLEIGLFEHGHLVYTATYFE